MASEWSGNLSELSDERKFTDLGNENAIFILRQASRDRGAGGSFDDDL